MDDHRFDEFSRLLANPGTRRAGLRAALALALGGAGIAATDADAKRKRRKKCEPPCAAGQTCVKGTCACDNGGTVCGANCCLAGQRCQDGQCVELPDPDTCIAFGEPCKAVGRRCCAGLTCGSGQGGLGDVACYVAKTGACTSASECTYGTECKDGMCVGMPQPAPAPTCDATGCPTCPVLSQYASYVEPGCLNGGCGCVCLAVGTAGYSGSTAGVNCTFGGTECAATPPAQSGCYDLAANSACTANSAFCCCVWT